MGFEAVVPLVEAVGITVGILVFAHVIKRATDYLFKGNKEV